MKAKSTASNEMRAEKILEAVKMGNFTLIKPNTFGYHANPVRRNSSGQLEVFGDRGELREVLQGGGKQIEGLNEENRRLRKKLEEQRKLLLEYEKALPLMKSMQGTGEQWVGRVESHSVFSRTQRDKMLRSER